MSFRPGLTGLWQVSGRSNITDFEEVVKLDTQYMHSDLFKKYVEIGMIPFFIWLIYILIFKTKILYKKQGFLVAEIYLLLTIYAIILYLTDNMLMAICHEHFG